MRIEDGTGNTQSVNAWLHLRNLDLNASEPYNNVEAEIR